MARENVLKTDRVYRLWDVFGSDAA